MQVYFVDNHTYFYLMKSKNEPHIREMYVILLAI